MALEIERKFLVTGDFRRETFEVSRIRQGYLNSHPGRTVRVRVRDERAYLTIKGASDENGLSRYEFEQAIPLEDAEELLKICEPGMIDKERFLVKKGNHTWEIDVFHGENEGLIVAELELRSEDEPFERPDWLGEEVSGDRRYYNSELTKHPFHRWE